MKPTYVDLTVQDVGQARAFFERVLGWRFEKFRSKTPCGPVVFAGWPAAGCAS